MIDDVDTPGSDGWWLAKLYNERNAYGPRLPRERDPRRMTHMRRSKRLDTLWDYRLGRVSLPGWSRQHEDDVCEFLGYSRTAYAGLVVEAMLDRIGLVGLRTVADQDADGDDTFRRVLLERGPWLKDALDFMLSMSLGWVMVTQSADGHAIVTAEDPRDITAAFDPIDPLSVSAALKVYRDDAAREHVAHLYLADDDSGPARVRVARRRSGGTLGAGFGASPWSWDDDASGPLPEPMREFGVPLVPLRNRLDVGEFEPHLDLIDRITDNIANRLWIAKVQAYKQRALVPDANAPELPDKDPETGEKVDLDSLFESAPDAMWELPPGYKLWESAPLDMTPILLGIRDDVKELSAATRTPLSMFTPDAATGSAEGASLMREGITYKAEDRIARIAPAVSKIGRMILAAEGRDAAGEVQPMWAPVERLSMSQRAEAVRAAKESGMPFELILTEVWQMDPATAKRAMDKRFDDALMSAVDAKAAPSADAGA